MQDPINLKSYRTQEAREKTDNYPDSTKEAKEEMAPDSSPKIKRSIKPSVALLAVIALGAIGLASYFYLQTAKLRGPQKVVEKEIEQLVSRVGELIVLPEGELPTLATVTDPEKLKDQPFFNKAKSGDKVLIYTNARKAILYDPSQHKIIEVAPLNIGTQ